MGGGVLVLFSVGDHPGADMSVDADLATLRKVLEDEGYRIDPDWGHIFQAFDRVEAELSRLREALFLTNESFLAEEARCARLERELDSDDHARGYRDGVREERRRSEARCARLEKTLREARRRIEVYETSANDGSAGISAEETIAAVTEALAGTDTP